MVTLFAVWFAYASNRAERIKAATLAITKFDEGQVWFDYQYDGFRRIDEPDPIAPDWMIAILGQYYFVDVAKVSLQGEQTVTNEDLSAIDMLTSVRWINLGRTPISDISSLRNQTDLEWLDISNTSIQAEDLTHLRRLTKLVRLVLDETELTDDGLRHLQNCKQLRELRLNNTMVSGAGFAHLAGNSIGKIELNDSPVDNEGLEQLSRIVGVADLSLERTKITDEGAHELAKLTELKELFLRSTELTDASVPHLSKLVKLIEIDLRDTNITDQGAKALHAKLPNCQIEWGKRGNRNSLFPGG